MMPQTGRALLGSVCIQPLSLAECTSPLHKWTHWDLSPGPSACEADVMPLHHVPLGSRAHHIPCLALMHAALIHAALMHAALMHAALLHAALMYAALMHAALIYSALMHAALMHVMTKVARLLSSRLHVTTFVRECQEYICKCRDPGSSRGPSDLQSDALPTELSRPLIFDHKQTHRATSTQGWPAARMFAGYPRQPRSVEFHTLPRVNTSPTSCAWSHNAKIRCSIVVSISACHAEDPGSIPGGGGLELSDVRAHGSPVVFGWVLQSRF